MVTEKGSHSQSNGVQQQYNGSIDHSISIDDSGKLLIKLQLEGYPSTV